ncbi:hypothetical protein E4U58_002175 [Claviceps cyperi]|nr:hypothetical protein E4U58_002175 [Claviceps cyperi]
MIASATKKNNWKWTYKASGTHNHPPESLFLSPCCPSSLPAREVGMIVRQRSDPSHTFFRSRDVYNDRQRIQQEQLDELSATQAWIRDIREKNLKHFIQYDDEHRVKSVLPDAGRMCC